MSPQKWNSKKYPDGCLSCGTTEKTHLGRGLCSTCYQREANGVENPETQHEDHVPELPIDAPAGVGDRDALDQDEEVLHEPSMRSGERRPGGGSSSVPSSQDDDSGQTKGWRSFFTKKERPAPASQIRPSKEKTPRKLGRRVSTSDTIEDIISGAGALAMRTNKHYPLGRYLQFSAPVSAEILDEAIQGTIIDRRVLQPIVKGRGRYDALGAVFGPPAIILAIENDPAKAPLLIPLLKSSIRNSLPQMAKAIKKVQAKEAAMEQAAKELFPDLPAGEDPADAVIAMIFEGWIPPAPPEPESHEAEPTESEEAAA